MPSRLTNGSIYSRSLLFLAFSPMLLLSQSSHQNYLKMGKKGRREPRDCSWHFSWAGKNRYVVPTGRVKVPAGRYVVPTGTKSSTRVRARGEETEEVVEERRGTRKYEKIRDQKARDIEVAVGTCKREERRKKGNRKDI
ncbi:hypothetical protein Tco_1245330 [Tanacetum coccineum]